MFALMTVLGLARLLNGDWSGKPSEARLVAELTRLRPSLVMSDFRYVDKLIGAYVTADVPDGRSYALGVDPLMAGWSLKTKRRYTGGEVLTYCRGRLALMLDTTATARITSIDIHWVSDRERSF